MNSERKNYPMKEFWAIFSISSILIIRSGYAKKDHISILAVIQKIWDLHKFGLQIWIQNAKITLWKNFGNFIDFFGMQKILNISCNSKKFTSILVISCGNSECKNYPMKEFIQKITLCPGSKKDHISILAVIQKNMGFT